MRLSRQLVSRLLDQLYWIARRSVRVFFVVLKTPGVAELLTFVLLYHYAADKWCEHFCGVWEPGYPRAWTVWVLVLIVVPVFALVQLFWLVGLRGATWMMERRGHKGGARGRGDVEEAEYMPLRESESDERVHSTPPVSPTSPTSISSSRFPQLSRLPSPYTILWWARITLYLALVCVGWWQYKHYEQPDDMRWRPALDKALSHNYRDRGGYGKGEKIFIAAAFFNNEDVLPYWTRTMLDVIAYLGPDNVFVSVVESNSNDRTPELLGALDDALGHLSVKRRVLVHDDAVPSPPDMAWNNRIDFLAAIRNRALEPLVETGGYDKVLFSNDILIEPESVLELLETADGQYDMACALDFAHFGAYDMWVLRDRIGHLAAGIWPYFFDAADYRAMKTGSPAPVFSCWNGIVAFAADPVLPVHLRKNATLSTSPLPRPPPPTHPLAGTLGASPALTPPIRFRSAPRGEGCFHSESFLLAYDLRRIMGLERIYVNPRVITAYVWKFYVWHKWVLRHPLVRWFVENVYDGAWMQYARMIIGEETEVYTWDGGDCQPWWYGGWW